MSRVAQDVSVHAGPPHPRPLYWLLIRMERGAIMEQQ